MKNKTIFIVISIVLALMIAAIVLLYVWLTTPRVYYSNLKSLHYSRVVGMSNLDRVSYDVECDDNQCTATVLPKGVEDADAKVIRMKETEVQELLDILNQYQVSKWDGFHKTNSYVLDGNSFTFSMETKNGESVSASGYMMYPINYDKCIEKLDFFFNNL